MMKERPPWWKNGSLATSLSYFDHTSSLCNAARSPTPSPAPSCGCVSVVNTAHTGGRSDCHSHSCTCGDPDCRNVIPVHPQASACVSTYSGHRAATADEANGTAGFGSYFSQHECAPEFLREDVSDWGGGADLRDCNSRAQFQERGDWASAIWDQPTAPSAAVITPSHGQFCTRNNVKNIETFDEVREDAAGSFAPFLQTHTRELNAREEGCGVHAEGTGDKVMIDLLLNMWRHGKMKEYVPPYAFGSKCGTTMGDCPCTPHGIGHGPYWNHLPSRTSCENFPPTTNCDNALCKCTVNRQTTKLPYDDEHPVSREAIRTGVKGHCTHTENGSAEDSSHATQHMLLNHLKRTIEKLQQNTNELYRNSHSGADVNQDPSAMVSTPVVSQTLPSAATKWAQKQPNECPCCSASVFDKRPRTGPVVSGAGVAAHSCTLMDCTSRRVTDPGMDAGKSNEEDANHVSPPSDTSPFYTGQSVVTYMDNDMKECTERVSCAAVHDTNRVKKEIEKFKGLTIDDMPSDPCPLAPTTLTVSSPPMSCRSMDEAATGAYNLGHGFHTGQREDKEMPRKPKEKSPNYSLSSFVVCSPDSSLTRTSPGFKHQRAPLHSASGPTATRAEARKPSAQGSGHCRAPSTERQPLTRSWSAAQARRGRRIMSPSPRNAGSPSSCGDRIPACASVRSEGELSALVHTDNSPPRRYSTDFTLPMDAVASPENDYRKDLWTSRRGTVKQTRTPTASSRYVSPIPHEVRTVLLRGDSLTMLDARRRHIKKLPPQSLRDNSLEHVFEKSRADGRQSIESRYGNPPWARYQRESNVLLSDIPPDSFRPSYPLSSRDYSSSYRPSWDTAPWRRSYVDSRTYGLGEQTSRYTCSAYSHADLDRRKPINSDGRQCQAAPLFNKEESEEVVKSWRKIVSPEQPENCAEEGPPPSVRSTKKACKTESPSRSSADRSLVKKSKTKVKKNSAKKVAHFGGEQQLDASSKPPASQDSVGQKTETPAVVSIEVPTGGCSSKRYGILSSTLEASGASTVEAMKNLKRRARSGDLSKVHRFGIRRRSVSPQSGQK